MSEIAGGVGGTEGFEIAVQAVLKDTGFLAQLTELFKKGTAEGVKGGDAISTSFFDAFETNTKRGQAGLNSLVKRVFADAIKAASAEVITQQKLASQKLLDQQKLSYKGQAAALAEASAQRRADIAVASRAEAETTKAGLAQQTAAVKAGLREQEITQKAALDVQQTNLEIYGRLIYSDEQQQQKRRTELAKTFLRGLTATYDAGLRGISDLWRAHLARQIQDNGSANNSILIDQRAFNAKQLELLKQSGLAQHDAAVLNQEQIAAAERAGFDTQLSVFTKGAAAQLDVLTKAAAAKGRIVTEEMVKAETTYTSGYSEISTIVKEGSLRATQILEEGITAQDVATQIGLDKQNAIYTEAAARRLEQMAADQRAQLAVIDEGQVAQASALSQTKLGALFSGGGLANLGLLAGGGLGLGYITSTLNNFQQIGNSIRVLFSGAADGVNKANDAIKQLQLISIHTPYQFKDLAAEAQQLVALKVVNPAAPNAVADLTDKIKTLFEQAARSNIPLSLLNRGIQAVARIGSTGTLQMQQLTQITRDLRLPLVDVAGAMGLTVDQLKELTKHGAIPAARGIQAVFDAMKAEPGASGIFQAQLHTIGGAFSNVKDNIQYLIVNALGPLGRAFVPVIAAFALLLQQINNFLSTSIGHAFIDFLTGVIAAGTALLVYKGVVEVFSELKLVFAAISADPTLLLTTRLLALAGILFALYQSVPLVRKVLDDLGQSLHAVLDLLSGYVTSFHQWADALVKGTENWSLVGYRAKEVVRGLGPIVAIQSSFGLAARTIRDDLNQIDIGLVQGFRADAVINGLSRLVSVGSEFGKVARDINNDLRDLELGFVQASRTTLGAGPVGIIDILSHFGELTKIGAVFGTVDRSVILGVSGISKHLLEAVEGKDSWSDALRRIQIDVRQQAHNIGLSFSTLGPELDGAFNSVKGVLTRNIATTKVLMSGLLNVLRGNEVGATVDFVKFLGLGGSAGVVQAATSVADFLRKVIVLVPQVFLGFTRGLHYDKLDPIVLLGLDNAGQSAAKIGSALRDAVGTGIHYLTVGAAVFRKDLGQFFDALFTGDAGTASGNQRPTFADGFLNGLIPNKASPSILQRFGNFLHDLIAKSGSFITGTLLPLVEDGLGKLGDAFATYGVPAILKGAQFLGRQLGLFVGSKSFVEILLGTAGALGAAILAIVGEFVDGFLKGLWARRFDLLHGLGDVVTFIFTSAFDVNKLATVIGAGLLGAFAIVKVSQNVIGPGVRLFNNLANAALVASGNIEGAKQRIRDANQLTEDFSLKSTGAAGGLAASFARIRSTFEGLSPTVKAGLGVFTAFFSNLGTGFSVLATTAANHLRDLVISGTTYFRDLFNVGSTTSTGIGTQLKSAFTVDNVMAGLKIAVQAAMNAALGYVAGFSSNAILKLGSLGLAAVNILGQIASGNYIGAAVSAAATVIGYFTGNSAKAAQQRKADLASEAQAWKDWQDKISASVKQVDDLTHTYTTDLFNYFQQNGTGTTQIIAGVGTELEHLYTQNDAGLNDFLKKYHLTIGQLFDGIKSDGGNVSKYVADTVGQDISVLTNQTDRALSDSAISYDRYSSQIKSAAESVFKSLPTGNLYSLVKATQVIGAAGNETGGQFKDSLHNLFNEIGSHQITLADFSSELGKLGIKGKAAKDIVDKLSKAFADGINTDPGVQALQALSSAVGDAVGKADAYSKIQGGIDAAIKQGTDPVSTFSGAWDALSQKIDAAITAQEAFYNLQDPAKTTLQNAQIAVSNQASALKGLEDTLDSYRSKALDTDAVQAQIDQAMHTTASQATPLLRQAYADAHGDLTAYNNSVDAISNNLAGPFRAALINSGTDVTTAESLTQTFIGYVKANAYNSITVAAVTQFGQADAEISNYQAFLNAHPLNLQVNTTLGSFLGAITGPGATSTPVTGLDSILAGLGLHKDKNGNIVANALGGIITAPQFSLVGEAGAELILPLTNQPRMSQLLAQLGFDAKTAEALSHQFAGHAHSAGTAAHQLAGAVGQANAVASAAVGGPQLSLGAQANAPGIQGAVKDVATGLAPLGDRIQAATKPGFDSWLASVDKTTTDAEQSFKDLATQMTLSANQGAQGVVNGFDQVLTAGTGEVRSIMSTYLGALVGSINPVLAAIGQPELKLAFAEGGQVPGVDHGYDSVPAMVRPGEFVVQKSMVDKYGVGRMHAINQGVLPHFATGGLVGNYGGASSALQRAVGDPYVWGGVGPSGYDCSGLWSMAYNAARGIADIFQREFTTLAFMGSGSQAQQLGFQRGPGTFMVGATADHMGGTLGGVNFEATPPRVRTGSSAWGADNPYFGNNIWHLGPGSLPVSSPLVVPLVPAFGNGALGTVASGLADYTRTRAQGFADANTFLSGTVAANPGETGGASNLAGIVGDLGAVAGWISAGMNLAGVSDPAWFSVLEKIGFRESRYNPSVVNNWDSNAKAGHPSKGWLQMIDSSFLSYAVPGHLDIFNPVDEAAAAIRYILGRYGSPEGTPANYYENGGLNLFNAVARLHPNELVLPLSKPDRTNDLMSKHGLGATNISVAVTVPPGSPAETEAAAKRGAKAGVDQALALRGLRGTARMA